MFVERIMDFFDLKRSSAFSESLKKLEFKERAHRRHQRSSKKNKIK